MLRFIKKKFFSITWSLLAISILIAPFRSFSMESDLDIGNPFSDPIEPGVYDQIKTIVIPALKRFFTREPQNLDEGISETVSRILGEEYSPSNNRVLEDGIESYGGNLLEQEFNKPEETFISKQLKPVFDKINNFEAKASSSLHVLYENKYRIAGGTVAAIIATVILVKVTQLLSEKAINLATKNDPKFLATMRQKNAILEKVKSLMGIKEDNTLFLNKENSENIPAFILRNNLISQSDDKNIVHKNLVLTGPDRFVKFKVCENIANNSGQKLVVIDAHSHLFNQDIGDDQKRILVKNLFDKLQFNGTSLVLVNLDNVSIDQLEKNGSKNILIDIINFSKNRCNKVGFVFTCPLLNGEYKQLLEGSYDEIINVERPDKNAREQIVSHMVNKVILNNSNSMLQKIGIKAPVISQEKQEIFKAYLTSEKISWIADNLEGKSYQEVQSFVMQLRALLSQKVIAPISNYDSVINILLNRADSDLLKNLLAKPA